MRSCNIPSGCTNLWETPESGPAGVRIRFFQSVNMFKLTVRIPMKHKNHPKSRHLSYKTSLVPINRKNAPSLDPGAHGSSRNYKAGCSLAVRKRRDLAEKCPHGFNRWTGPHEPLRRPPEECSLKSRIGSRRRKLVRGRNQSGEGWKDGRMKDPRRSLQGHSSSDQTCWRQTQRKAELPGGEKRKPFGSSELFLTTAARWAEPPMVA